MKALGKIEEIFIASKENKSKQREIQKELIFKKNHGILGDKFAGKNLNRAIMIIGLRAYNIAKENNINLKIGSLGENLLLDFNPHELKSGEVIILGDIHLEITTSCSICKHLAIYDERLASLLEFDRGIYCKVLRGGILNKNTSVILKDI